MCGPKFCSMKITREVRAYAAARGLDDARALEEGLQAKAREFAEGGGALYRPA